MTSHYGRSTLKKTEQTLFHRYVSAIQSNDFTCGTEVLKPAFSPTPKMILVLAGLGKKSLKTASLQPFKVDKNNTTLIS